MDDSIFNAGVPLHPSLHTGVLPGGGAQNPPAAVGQHPAGVHHYPTPVADIQLVKYDDYPRRRRCPDCSSGPLRPV